MKGTPWASNPGGGTGAGGEAAPWGQPPGPFGLIPCRGPHMAYALGLGNNCHAGGPGMSDEAITNRMGKESLRI